MYADEYEDVFRRLTINETSYVIIVTRGHRDDMRVLKLAIGTTQARYIAMIGSKRKVINVIRELEKEGIPRAAFERIFAPMGLDIGAISPEEIAISVAAEMIAVRTQCRVQLARAFAYPSCGRIHPRRARKVSAPSEYRWSNSGRRRIAAHGLAQSPAPLPRRDLSRTP